MAANYEHRVDRFKRQKRGYRRSNKGIGQHAAIAPDHVKAERDVAFDDRRWTPNMVALGDPLPGRSALERRSQ